MSLPFELRKKHKTDTKGGWKRKGLIMDNFESIYQEYIHQTNCELCGKLFETTRDRHMDHSHTTGEFRNIVCRNCNLWKADRLRKYDISPYILKKKDKICKQGFRYVFRISRYKKVVVCKQSTKLEILEAFRDKWIAENSHWFT